MIYFICIYCINFITEVFLQGKNNSNFQLKIKEKVNIKFKKKIRKKGKIINNKQVASGLLNSSVCTFIFYPL